VEESDKAEFGWLGGLTARRLLRMARPRHNRTWVTHDDN
jgi:hypothetical protein